MQKAIIGIGIPGSGKSTLLKNFANQYGYVYICPDDIRERITGNTQDQTQNARVWQETYARAAAALKASKAVIVDATFAEASGRKSFLKFLRDKGAQKIQGVWIDIPLEVAKERNLQRNRVVPEYVLERMHEQLLKKEPNLAEGFDSLFTFDELQQLTQAEINREGHPVSKF